MYVDVFKYVSHQHIIWNTARAPKMKRCNTKPGFRLGGGLQHQREGICHWVLGTLVLVLLLKDPNPTLLTMFCRFCFNTLTLKVGKRSQFVFSCFFSMFSVNVHECCIWWPFDFRHLLGSRHLQESFLLGVGGSGFMPPISSETWACRGMSLVSPHL